MQDSNNRQDVKKNDLALTLNETLLSKNIRYLNRKKWSLKKFILASEIK